MEPGCPLHRFRRTELLHPVLSLDSGPETLLGPWAVMRPPPIPRLVQNTSTSTSKPTAPSFLVLVDGHQCLTRRGDEQSHVPHPTRAIQATGALRNEHHIGMNCIWRRKRKLCQTTRLDQTTSRRGWATRLRRGHGLDLPAQLRALAAFAPVMRKA